MRPIYKILIIIGIIFGVGLIIYFIWNKITGEPRTAPDGETTSRLPIGGTVNGGGTTNGGVISKTSSLKKLSDQKVFDFWITENTGEIYYLNPLGEVFAAKDGPDLEVAEQNVEVLNLIEVAPAGRKILAAFGDPQNPQWAIFDVIDKVWRPLPQEVINATWSENDEKIIALIRSGGEINLVEADLTKTPPAYKTFLRNFAMKDVRLISNLPQKVLIVEKSSVAYESRLWQFDLKTLNFNLLVSPQAGLEFKPSSPKKEMFFQFKSPGELVILDNRLNLIANEFSFITLPQKCTTKNTSTVYCFEPQNLTEKIILPDHYFQKKFYSIDNLSFGIFEEYEGFETIISSGKNNIPPLDGYNPQIAGDKLYFINRYDNFLYSLTLP